MQLAPHSGGWSRRHWPASSEQKLRRHVPPSNSPCQPVQGRIAWDTAIRAITDANPRATVLSIDGIGAYDHVLRSAMLTKLADVPQLQGLIPFVRSVYAQPTAYSWEDEDGVRREVVQHEGGEQGDPLMGLFLFSLAVHDSLCAAKQHMLPGEHLFAYSRRRLRGGPCQIALGQFTTCWGRSCSQERGSDSTLARPGSGTKRENAPQILMIFAPEVWSPQGMKILGTPIGTVAYEEAACAERLEEEEKLWHAIHWIPDLQCAWQVLVQCAGHKVPSSAKDNASPTIGDVRTRPRFRNATGHAVPSW